MKDSHSILKESISTLEISIAFKAMCEMNGFTNLGDMVSIPIHLLEKKPGMNRHLIMEFFEIMKKYGLEEMIKEVF